MTLELNGKPVAFVDTPGLAWSPSEEEDRERRRSQSVLLRNKGRIDRLKDPTPAVSYIVSRTETEDLMVAYGLPAFAKGDVDAFLLGIARAHGLIKKVGHPISVYIVAPFADYMFSSIFWPSSFSGWKPGPHCRCTHRLTRLVYRQALAVRRPTGTLKFGDHHQRCVSDADDDIRGRRGTPGETHAAQGAPPNGQPRATLL